VAGAVVAGTVVAGTVDPGGAVDAGLVAGTGFVQLAIARGIATAISAGWSRAGNDMRKV
jgi:hypothetical protein